MEETSKITLEAPDMPLTALIFPSALLVGYIWYYCFLEERNNNNNNNNNRPLYPPMVPGGIFKILPRFWDVSVADHLLAWAREHGNIFRIPLAPPGRQFCVVSDGGVARKILENSQTAKFLPIYNMFDPISGGPSFFSSEGPRYKHARKATNPAFAKDCVEIMMTEVKKATDRWIVKNLASSEEKQMDLSVEMQRLTIEIIGKVAFDYGFSEDEITFCQNKIGNLLKEFVVNSQKNPLRKYLSWLIPEVKQAYRDSREMLDFTKHVLDHYRRKSASASHKVIHLVMENDQYESDAERVRDLMLYLGAGYDTSAATVGWTMLELAKNPGVQSWLRDELLKIPDEDRYNCAPLMHVIRESMRLNPASGFGSVREVVEEIRLGDGTMIPCKSIIMTNIYAMHRDAGVYQQPDEFIPSRWTDPTPAMQRSYMPFAVGRRNCQGQALANVELKVIVAKLILDCEWTVVKEGRREFSGSLKTAGTTLKSRRL